MFSISPSKIENGAMRENVKRMNILKVASNKIILPFGTVEMI